MLPIEQNEYFPKGQYKNHLAGHKITLGDLHSCVFLTVSVTRDARWEYSSFSVREGLNSKLLSRRKNKNKQTKKKTLISREGTRVVTAVHEWY